MNELRRVSRAKNYPLEDNVSLCILHESYFCFILILEKGNRNEIYNVAAENHMTNLEVVDEILSKYDSGRECLEFVPNRWGQDLRYSVSSGKLRDLGWLPEKESRIYTDWMK